MHYQISSLDLQFAGTSVENYFMSTEGSKRLAIVFPGMGYTSMGPMLYYSVNTLAELGMDTLVLEYGSVLRTISKEDQDRLLELCLVALNSAFKLKKYDKLTLVGKSIGTRALSLLSQSRGRWLYVPEQIESLWLTPLLGNPLVVQEISRLGSRQFLAIGTQDHPHYLPGVIEGLPSSAEVYIQNGGDHGLDIEGDSVESARQIAALVERIAKFLKH